MIANLSETRVQTIAMIISFSYLFFHDQSTAITVGNTQSTIKEQCRLTRKRTNDLTAQWTAFANGSHAIAATDRGAAEIWKNKGFQPIVKFWNDAASEQDTLGDAQAAYGKQIEADFDTTCKLPPTPVPLLK